MNDGEMVPRMGVVIRRGEPIYVVSLRSLSHSTISLSWTKSLLYGELDGTDPGGDERPCT